MKSDWTHLPNAKHIDLMLADLKSNHKKWMAAWELVCGAGSIIPIDMAPNAATIAYKDILTSGRSAAWGAASQVTWNSARYAAIALIAYDDCAYLLDSTPDELKVIIALSGESNPAAILLLSAVIAMQKEMDESNEVVTPTKRKAH